MLVVFAGCDRRPATPAAPVPAVVPAPAALDAQAPPALAIEWPSPAGFQVVGQPSLGGEVHVYGGAYRVSLRGFPAGTRWEVSGRTGQLEPFATGFVDLADVTAALLDVPVAGLEDARLGGGSTLMLTPPEGGRVEVPLPSAPVNGMGVHDLFARVEHGPLLFPGEAPAGQAPRSILLTYGFAHEFRVFGRPAERLRDIDGVAVRRIRPAHKTRLCHGTRGLDQKVLPDVTLRLRETEVVVYDRRRGTVVDRRVFPPDERCPGFDVRDSATDSFVPSAAIDEWLRSLVEP